MTLVSINQVICGMKSADALSEWGRMKFQSLSFENPGVFLIVFPRALIRNKVDISGIKPFNLRFAAIILFEKQWL